MELRQPAGDPTLLRPQAHPEERVPAEDAGQADQAQGRGRPGERLRRGARGRADLPQHRAPRQGQEAHQAAVAPVHDPRRHPQRLRRTPRGPRHAAPGGCRLESLRGRLDRGHQRHPRHDRVQLQARRVLQDHRGAGADPYPGHRGGARGRHPRFPPRALLGGDGHVPGGRRGVRGALVRREVQEEGERAQRPARAHLGGGRGRGRSRQVPGPGRAPPRRASPPGRRRRRCSTSRASSGRPTRASA